MHWALDRNQSVVAASDVLVYAAPFTCAVCNEPVYLRRGVARVSHFAHFSMGRDWDCSLYSPSASIGLSNEAVNRPAAARMADRAASNQHTTAAKLCADLESYQGRRLLLRLPFTDVAEDEASFVLRSRFGVRNDTTSSSSRRTFVPVPIAVPPALCTGDESAEYAVAEINSALEAFRTHGNYFSLMNGKGVLLAETDELKLSHSYLLITQRKLSIRERPGALVIQDKSASGSIWYAYIVELPPAFRSLEECALAEQILGRRICFAPAPPFVTFPFPYRIAADGVPIMEAGNDTLYLIHSSGEELTATQGENSCVLAATSMRNLYAISVQGFGDVVLRTPTFTGILARIEESDPFRPAGVQVRHGSELHELFELDSLPSSWDGDIHVAVPSDRVWRISTIGQRPAFGADLGPELALPRGTRCVDFLSFGWVQAAPEKPSAKIIPHDLCNSAQAFKVPNALLGLVMRMTDKRCLNDLLAVRTKEDGFRWAATYGTHSLLPQVLRALQGEVMS